MLIRKYVHFEWESRHQAAFENFQEVLCSDHVLAYPDFGTQIILRTDASKFVVAAILSQVQDGAEHPISYVNMQINKPEQNYSALKQRF